MISPTASYQVIDTQTGAVVRTYRYAQRNAARRMRDRLDNAHGGYRYVCRLVQD